MVYVEHAYGAWSRPFSCDLPERRGGGEGVSVSGAVVGVAVRVGGTTIGGEVGVVGIVVEKSLCNDVGVKVVSSVL